MKILHLSTRDIAGGAAKAAFRLHKEMIARGLDSSLLVLQKERMGDETIKTTSKINSKILSPLRTFVNLNIKSYLVNNTNHPFSIDYFGSSISNNPIVKEADIIIIHWTVSSFLTIHELGKIIRHSKISLWVLHDMWAMTGGCHHSFECVNYSKECYPCPLTNNKIGQKVIKHLFRLKKQKYIKAQNLKIITPSNWLADCARNSFLLRDLPIKVLANTLDRSIFKPLDKSYAKQVYNINPACKLILFVAEHGSNNPYKGWSYLVEALNLYYELSDMECELLVIGSDRNASIDNEINYPMTFTGRLIDDYSLSIAYNAADVFLCPSLADNLPNTILESLSCSTPVVAFNIGGIVDMIDHKRNGYLAESKNSRDLVNGIDFVLKNSLATELPNVFDNTYIVNELLKYAMD